jgi:hypothetical protein
MSKTMTTIVNSYEEKMNSRQQQVQYSSRSNEGIGARDIERNRIANLHKAIGNQGVQRLIRSGDLTVYDTLQSNSINGSASQLRNATPPEIVPLAAVTETMAEEVAVNPDRVSPPANMITTDAQIPIAEEKNVEEVEVAAAVTAPTSTNVLEQGAAPIVAVSTTPKEAAAGTEEEISVPSEKVIEELPKKGQKEEAVKVQKTEEESAPVPKAKGEKKDSDAAEAAPPSPYKPIAPAIQAVNQRTRGLRKHSESPHVPVASAQAAAIKKTIQQTRDAAVQTVEAINVEKDKAKKVQLDEFKNRLQQAIEAIMKEPKTESEAKEVMSSGAKDASDVMRGELASQREAAVGPLKTAANIELKPSEQKPLKEKNLEREPLGKPPKPVSPEPVVPAPLPAERLDYSSDREPTERAMSEAGVTKEHIEKGNEPEFTPALEARSEAEQHEAQVVAHYRESEATIQDQAREEAGARITINLGGMHEARTLHIGKVIAQQLDTNSRDAIERERITGIITEKKDRTKKDVNKILNTMETSANRNFGDGLTQAEKVYAAAFKKAKGGLWNRLTKWRSRWKKLIESSLKTARKAYLDEVNTTINKVAALVDAKIQEAKQRVALGRKEVDDFVNNLNRNVRQYGEDARKEVSKEFDGLESEIDQRRDKLVDNLAHQYKASYKRMSAMEEKLREENKSLWERVYDATVGLVKKILAFKDMLLSVLSKAADVVGDIISDPIGFLGNLVSGVMQGLENFKTNIGIHLKKGLLSWLLGALAGTGLQLPETFDLKGILSILLQIFGLTYANFRARAVNIVGGPTVAALEKTAEIFRIIATEGVFGIVRLIMEKLEELKSMVLDAIFDFIKERVIMAGIKWIISLLNPASAFFKAIKAIYEIVMFIINRGSQIMEFVNAVVDSIGAIAKGNISIAAAAVEDALAKAVPLAIGFLAALLDIGDPSKPVRSIMEKAETPVNNAIDWVINKAVDVVKAAGKLFGTGKKEKEKPDERTEEEKMQDLKKAVEEGERLLENRQIPLTKVGKELSRIKTTYRLVSLDIVTASKDEAVEIDYIEGQINPRVNGRNVERAYHLYPPLDLQWHEDQRGHLIERHVGKSDKYLIERAVNEDIGSATRWKSIRIAQRVVREVVGRNVTRINNWLDTGAAGNLVLEYQSSGEMIGEGYRRMSATLEETSSARIILAAGGPNEWYIITGYPWMI